MNIHKTIKEQNAARKRKQREAIRKWVQKQTNGRLTTAEAYVMEQMKKGMQS